jgi:hypothetical protein
MRGCNRNLGARNVPEQGAHYALYAPGTEEAFLPAGTIPLHCPTSLVSAYPGTTEAAPFTTPAACSVSISSGP